MPSGLTSMSSSLSGCRRMSAASLGKASALMPWKEVVQSMWPATLSEGVDAGSSEKPFIMSRMGSRVGLAACWRAVGGGGDREASLAARRSAKVFAAGVAFAAAAEDLAVPVEVAVSCDSALAVEKDFVDLGKLRARPVVLHVKATEREWVVKIKVQDELVPTRCTDMGGIFNVFVRD